MNLFLRNVLFPVRVILTGLVAFSFLGFATAIYNPQFHEKLHPHELHEPHAINLEQPRLEHQTLHEETTHAKDQETDAGKESHVPNASSHMCNVQSHIATSITSIFKLRMDANPLPESIQIGHENVYLSGISRSFSSRAPPVSI